MRRFNNPLDQVKVAAPCPADWDQMIGDERVRFCGLCNLNVYNLSGMTRNQAESLLSRHEGRLCIRYYRKADGTILTQNCPVGLQALKQRVNRVANAVLSAVMTFFAGIGLYHTASIVNENEINAGTTMGTMTAPEIKPTPVPEPPKTPTVGEVTMGAFSPRTSDLRSPNRLSHELKKSVIDQ